MEGVSFSRSLSLPDDSSARSLPFPAIVAAVQTQKPKMRSLLPPARWERRVSGGESRWRASPTPSAPGWRVPRIRKRELAAFVANPKLPISCSFSPLRPSPTADDSHSYQASKGSAYFRNQQKKDADLTIKVEGLVRKLDRLVANRDAILLEEERAVDRMIIELEKERDLTQVSTAQLNSKRS